LRYKTEKWEWQPKVVGFETGAESTVHTYRKGQRGQETTLKESIWERDACEGGRRTEGGLGGRTQGSLQLETQCRGVRLGVGGGQGGREGRGQNAALKGKRKENQGNRLPESTVRRV